jgi:RimJ/RimL family protein N-acetyltransferase
VPGRPRPGAPRHCGEVSWGGPDHPRTPLPAPAARPSVFHAVGRSAKTTRRLGPPAILRLVSDLHTERLILHPIDTAEAERIVARQRCPEDSWAQDFPFDGDVIGATAFLRATAASGDQRPFGHYRISRTADGLAIGGVGFKDKPDNGGVEIGYGLVPSARGSGYAEAVRAVVALARRHGLTRIVANTDEGNIASHRTLEHAGFTRRAGTATYSSTRSSSLPERRSTRRGLGAAANAPNKAAVRRLVEVTLTLRRCTRLSDRISPSATRQVRGRELPGGT